MHKNLDHSQHKGAMEESKIPINVITNQGFSTGVGRTASETYRVLKPYFPKLTLYSLNYIKNEELEFSNQISKYHSRGLPTIPIVNWLNTRVIRRSGLLRNSNLHIIGTDYTLVEESRKNIIMAHELYFILGEIFKVTSMREFVKEIAFNYSVFLLQKYIKSAKYVVTPSKVSADQVKKATGVTPVVAPISVDKRKFHKRDKEKVREVLGLPKDKFLLLNVSGGGSNKNLRTMESIANNLPENILILKINAPVYNKRVLNFGKVSEEHYPSFFSAADVYLHTSIHEGFGIPLLESLSSGLPIISPSCSTAPEILSKSGYYVQDPMSPQGYIEHITSLMDVQLLKESQQMSLERSNFFSDERLATTMGKLYLKAFA